MKFEAVLFDCDGVLVDSEPITNGVLRDMLEEQGWVLTPAECMHIFVGKAVKDEIGAIEANTGKPVTEAWMAEFRARRNQGLEERLLAVPLIHPAVETIHAHHAGRIACASGADRFKVELQLAKVGLMPYFEGRVFSGHEMPRSKPAPDVYLAAARALGVDAARCAVVEDTVTGVMAGVAAGATVFGYVPGTPEHEDPHPLLAAGATAIFRSMAELPALVC
jgi:HAD superfamily hydrolase (TIGR01509 family)